MNVLFRYTGIPLEEYFEDFTGHAGKWCWWAIADELRELGHDLTPVNWNDYDWRPERVFDAVFSIQHLRGLAGACGPDTKKIIRLTTAYPLRHNQQVLDRIWQINDRRKCNLIPRRLLTSLSRIG